MSRPRPSEPQLLLEVRVSVRFPTTNNPKHPRWRCNRSSVPLVGSILDLKYRFFLIGMDRSMGEVVNGIFLLSDWGDKQY
ncbi:hypothetical protein CEXT_187481 [Caerostris extrusa]|uniref:Uncharacterized protein n=1 Tax=Caerostris extrusa TaxID=172846 RepID=A0AAV4WW82_CAEEX|nr:hypothetical protein CEXT_187481 [Caerostris extrusa]